MAASRCSRTSTSVRACPAKASTSASATRHPGPRSSRASRGWPTSSAARRAASPEPLPGMAEVWKPSVTVAAVMQRGDRFCLVEEEAEGRLVYNQPAGHWEPGETLAEACAREALEETAHSFRPTHLL